MAQTESNILSWTPGNWITVLLMFGLGYFILGAIVRIVQQKKAQQSSAAA